MNANSTHVRHPLAVEVGKRADLLLLRQDPTQTIEAYAGIVRVLLGGRVLDPADLVANRSH